MNVPMFIAFFTTFNTVHGEYFSVFPSYLKLSEGEGMVLQVRPAEKPLTSCSVRFGTYTADLFSGKEDKDLGVSYWGTGLETGECGLKLTKFNSTIHAVTWIFTITTADGEKGTAYSTVQISETSKPTELNEFLQTTFGDTTVISCDAYVSGAYYCRLFNPSKELVLAGTNCTKTISSVRTADIGEWRCALGMPLQIEDQVHKINVTAFSGPDIEIGFKETSIGRAMFCNHKTRNITYCRWQRRGGLVLLLRDGINIERYSYYGRGIAQNDCGIVIERPIQEDLQIWTCTLGLMNGQLSGGYVDLSNKGEVMSNDFTPPPPRNIFVLKGTSLRLSCSLDTPLNYCWFKHPNGTRYFPQPHLKNVGWSFLNDGITCELEVNSAQFSDDGTWICGMGLQGQPQLPQHLQIKLTVQVADTPFTTKSTTVLSRKGDWVILGCSSLNGEALESCSFISPNETSYNLKPGRKGRFSYHGAGIEYGECGILISSIEASDFGEWTCVTKFASLTDRNDYTRKILLFQTGILSSSASVGVTLGVLSLLGVAVGGIWYRKRRQRNRPLSTSRPITLSVLSDSSDDVTHVSRS